MTANDMAVNSAHDVRSATILVSVPLRLVEEQLRCPWCQGLAVAFDHPTLGEPWRVQCRNMHVYTVVVDLREAHP